MPLWESERIASQWASPRLNLVRSGAVLFLTDSERRLHVLKLRTGELQLPALELAEVSEVCAFDDVEMAVWIRDHSDYSRRDEGLRVSSFGERSRARRPASCNRRNQPLRHDRKCAAALAKKKPKLLLGTRHDLAQHGVALASAAAGQRLGTLLVGYELPACEATWEAPVAFTSEPYHDDSQLKVELTEQRIYAIYQLADGRWYLGARDSRSGALLWHREPPRAHYGTNLQKLTASSARVYLGVNWRLELFDPAQGDSIGVIW